MKVRGGQFREGEGQGAVALFDQDSGGWPVGPEGLRVERVHGGVERGTLDFRDAVAPDGEHALGNEDPFHLSVEPRKIEPVQRLGHRNQTHRGVRQSGRFGESDAVADIRVRFGRGDLFLARVRGGDASESCAKGARRLAAAGGAIPDRRCPWHEGGEVIEERLRIPGAKIGVAPGHTGEVIGEGEI